MRFLIEEYERENGWTDFGHKARELGHEVSIIRADRITAVARDLTVPTMMLGTFQGIREAEQASPKIIVWTDWAAMNCLNWYPKFGQYLLNNDYSFVQVTELLRQRWLYFKVFCNDTKIFVRPNLSTKPFTGQLMDLQDIDKILTQQLSEELVIVSSPKKIRGEWRFILSQTGIVGLSSYSYRGNITTIPFAPPKVKALAERMISIGYFPKPLIVVDIAETFEDEVFLMELNSFSSSGLYACSNFAKEIIAVVEPYFGTSVYD